MGLQERIKKVQDFEQNLEAEQEVEQLARTKQIDNIKRKIHQRLITELSDIIYKKKISDAELKLKVRKYTQQFLNENNTPLSLDEKNIITNDLIDDIVGYGPIEEFLSDNEVTEVMVNGFNDIYIEKFGKK